MKINLVLLAAIALLTASCKFREGNFSVEAPEGWRKIESLQNGKKFVKMLAPDEDSSIHGFIENIRIGIIHSYHLDTYIASLVSDIKKSATYYENKGNGVTSTSHFEAKWIQHVVMNIDKEKIEQKVYFIGDNGIIYMIVCSAKKDGIAAIQSKIDEVLNSFRML